MHTQAQSQSTNRRQHEPSLPIYANEGLSPKKTFLVIITVVGCIAILWPKVFYPMMFASTPTAGKSNIKGGAGGCCDVVLNREEFFNSTLLKKPKTSEPPIEPYGPQLYRKSLNPYTGEISIRQERSSHLHPDSVYEAMRERGRAIPATPTIPIVERKSSPSNPPPRIVEGRPGPIPGMRPPMGAGSIHQPQARQGTMGLIMPVYTIGIIIFFGYTIMKIVMKKQAVNAPYGAAPGDPNFRKEVFGKGNGRHVEDLNGSKLDLLNQQQRGSVLYNVSMSAQAAASNLSSSLKQHQFQQQQQQQQQQPPLTSKVMTKDTDQLMEIEKLRKKLEDTEKAMAKLIGEMNSDQYEAKVNSNENSTTTNQQQPQQSNISNGHADINEKSGDVNSRVDDLKATDDKRKKREGSTDRTVSSKHDEDDVMPEPQEIYLEGSLAHDSQILVAESETKQEKVYDAELNGSPEEPAVILSSKMTLSLINLDNILDKKSPTKQPDLESPLADDIEIIGHDEH
ncbi:resistance to inhibitors of cholinesterase protein 3 isoform X2 [Calliphora vicina]|uniref:resistance to inhibitors of cholinesterase protein 3 isoform X2 n=1 Tax=Calliphora vicina TaxID=7373 RepID=UPI00325A73BA